MDVRRKFNILQQYCAQNLLEVIITKSKISEFHKGRNKILSQSFLYNNSPIHVVNKYNYLGVVFSSSEKFNIYAEESSKK